MVRVHLFGRFWIAAPAGEVILPTAKARLLTAFVFWQQGRWVRRELLRGMLWGELDDERAAGNLRTALYSLRRGLVGAGAPPDLLEVRRDALRAPVRPDCVVDVRLFEEKAWAGLRKEVWEVEPLVGAASLYQGDFLEDLDADWCQAERRRLNDLHLAVLRALVERLSASGLFEAALSYASRWLEVDPLEEAAHQALMRLYAALGKPAKVVEQFEQCRQVLEKELGVGPGEATLRLLRELVPSSGGPVATSQGRTSGRGRKGSRRAAAARSSPSVGERMSSDPLRNARLLLAAGEALALDGSAVEGVQSLEKAITLYDRFGGPAARARLLLGEVLLWLSVPLSPKMDGVVGERGLRYIGQALEYYRTNGPAADRQRALQLGAQALWLMGRNQEAAALAKEGLDLAVALGEREAEACMAAVLGFALREQHRLGEARAALDQAVEGIPFMTVPWEVLWVLFQRGILSYIIGELKEAERFLREALALVRAIPFPSLMVKVGECMTRSMMVVVLHYQDRFPEIEGFLKPEMGRYNPEPFIYLNPLFAAGEERRSILPGVQGWLRARLMRLPRPMAACTVRSVVEEMLAPGFFPEASRWAGVGVRLARAYGWGAFQALFYCHRAVALLKMGRPAAAARCRRRAALLADPADRWVPAWLARVDGLLALAQGDKAAAESFLEESRRRFLKIGSRYDARQVGADLTHRVPA